MDDRAAAQRLVDAEARYQQWMTHLGDAEAKARDAREDAIRQAHADGLSTRDIARLIGLSHQRVSQIVRSPRRR